jgi:hypothetical protein
MFTVKQIINPDSTEQEEFLYQAAHVFHTNQGSLPGVRLQGEGGVAEASVILNGRGSIVYVMNENGATVARYNL